MNFIIKVICNKARNQSAFERDLSLFKNLLIYLRFSKHYIRHENPMNCYARFITKIREMAFILCSDTFH